MKNSLSLLLLTTLVATGCENTDTNSLIIPSAKSKITVISDLIETTSSSTAGFDAAEWYRNHFGVVVDTASFIYPELQVMPVFEGSTLKISANATGMVKFDGSLNQNRIDKVDIIGTPASTSVSETYHYFLGKKNERAAKERLAEKTALYGLLPAQALTAYELAIEDSFKLLSEAKIPGKNSNGDTKVFTLKAAAVKVTCTPLEKYKVAYSSYYSGDKNKTTVDMVGETGCIARLGFAVR